MLILLAAFAQDPNAAITNQSALASPIWSNPAIAATIGAISALIVSILKDYFFEKAKSNREKKRYDSDIFISYLGPLSDSCEKLVWRFHEFFVDNRYEFLKSLDTARTFNNYKRTSTLYRIATLIGWVRGMELELNSLAAHNPGYTPPIAKQISSLRGALADGPSLELERLQQICRIWHLNNDGFDHTALAQLGLLFESKAYEFFNEEGIYLSEAEDIDEGRKYRVVRKLADFLSGRLNNTPLSDSIIRETLKDIVTSLIFRKALIYREWQDAIGDAMIIRDPDSPRRFRIVGFAAFSNLIEDDKSPWFKVLSSSLEDIDLANPTPRDFRVVQIRKTAHSVAAMLIAIDAVGKPSPVKALTLSAAKKLLTATSDVPKSRSNAPTAGRPS